MRSLFAVLLPWWSRASARPLVAVGLVTAGVVLALTADARIASLQVDPSVPRTRVTIVLACIASNLLVAWAGPVLPLEERLAARRGWWNRFAAASLGVAVPVGLVLALCPDGGAGDVVARLVGFAGLGLAFASVAPGLGVVVPWAYAISGLAFGYTTSVGGPAELQPWAWMVGEVSGRWPAVVILVVGLGVFAWREPRLVSESSTAGSA